jgi:hypothetical protein
MPMSLSSLPFFILLSTGNYYAKNIHPQTESDLAYRISEFAAKQITIALSQCMLSVYTDSAYEQT